VRDLPRVGRGQGQGRQGGARRARRRRAGGHGASERRPPRLAAGPRRRFPAARGRRVTMPSADDPFSLLIFGASGDLTRRKLIPALWSLYAARTLPEPFTIVGTARTELSDEAFRGQMREAVASFARVKIPAAMVWDRFAQNLVYVAGDPSRPDLYPRLKERLETLERSRGGPTNRVFYAATPPSLYDDIADNLGAADLAQAPSGWTRVVIEKPFGRDLESARALNRQL